MTSRRRSPEEERCRRFARRLRQVDGLIVHVIPEVARVPFTVDVGHHELALSDSALLDGLGQRINLAASVLPGNVAYDTVRAYMTRSGREVVVFTVGDFAVLVYPREQLTLPFDSTEV